MRKFYLISLDPDEEVIIVSSPQQIYRGGGAYGSQVSTHPETAAIITVTNPT